MGHRKPQAYTEKPMRPKRVTVWYGFWSRGIIGPFSFETKQVEALSFIPPPNEYDYIYALLSGPAIDLQKILILAEKKIELFRWSSF